MNKIALLFAIVVGATAAAAPGPPQWCWATIISASVPMPIGPTWVGPYYTYVWDWSCDFRCGSGGPTACFVCETVGGNYSLDGGATWIPWDNGGSSVTNQMCGLSYQAGWTTILNAEPGGIYNVIFGVDANTQNKPCGANGYLVVKELQLAVPGGPKGWWWE